MPASYSRGVRGALSAQRFILLRELGSRGARAWAAIQSAPDSRPQLVVVERVPSNGNENAIADLLRDVRRLSALHHPNVVPVRGAALQGEELLVVSEFVDGVSWSELVAHPTPPSLEIALHILADVLAGLGALHALRDADHGLGLVHGEVVPDCILVGIDGIARVAGACRWPSAAAGSPSSAVAHLAPELLLGNGVADGRADVYGAGVLLWEALTGRPLFGGLSASQIVESLRGDGVPHAPLRAKSPWSQPLIAVASRALAVDPEKRFASVEAFANEVLRVAGKNLATTSRVAAFVRATHGNAIRSRREELELERDAALPAGGPAVPATLASGRSPTNLPAVPVGQDALPAQTASAPPPFPKAPRLPTGMGAAPSSFRSEVLPIERFPSAALLSVRPAESARVGRPSFLVATFVICLIGLLWVAGLVVNTSPNMATPGTPAASGSWAGAAASGVPSVAPPLAPAEAPFEAAAAIAPPEPTQAAVPARGVAKAKHEPSGI